MKLLPCIQQLQEHAQATEPVFFAPTEAELLRLIHEASRPESTGHLETWTVRELREYAFAILHLADTKDES